LSRFVGKLAALNELLEVKQNELQAEVYNNNIAVEKKDLFQLEVDISAIRGRIQQVQEFILEDEEERNINEAIDRIQVECPGLFGGAINA